MSTMTALKIIFCKNSLKFSTTPIAAAWRFPDLLYFIIKSNCDMLAAQQQLYLIKNHLFLKYKLPRYFAHRN